MVNNLDLISAMSTGTSLFNYQFILITFFYPFNLLKGCKILTTLIWENNNMTGTAVHRQDCPKVHKVHTHSLWLQTVQPHCLCSMKLPINDYAWIFHVILNFSKAIQTWMAVTEMEFGINILCKVEPGHKAKVITKPPPPLSSGKSQYRTQHQASQLQTALLYGNLFNVLVSC